jgi:hypothetical protein
MKTKRSTKSYWEMTTAQLREATKKFDEEFVGDEAQPLTPEMKTRWERAKAKGASDKNGSTESRIVGDETLLALAQDLEGTKRKNIIEMALTFTAMIRIFEKKAKTRVVKKLEELFCKLPEVRSPDDYEALHRDFCLRFTQDIKMNGLRRGSTSYGQAAKILDVVIKVYVYYCAQPSPEDSKRIIPWLHGAVDTAILKYLKKYKCAPGQISANTIKEIDEAGYHALQSLLAKSRPECLRNLHPVEYDDILWRSFARQDDVSAPGTPVTDG